jgi:hypothetical protein
VDNTALTNPVSSERLRGEFTVSIRRFAPTTGSLKGCTSATTPLPSLFLQIIGYIIKRAEQSVNCFVFGGFFLIKSNSY